MNVWDWYALFLCGGFAVIVIATVIKRRIDIKEQRKLNQWSWPTKED